MQLWRRQRSIPVLGLSSVSPQQISLTTVKVGLDGAFSALGQLNLDLTQFD